MHKKIPIFFPTINFVETDETYMAKYGCTIDDLNKSVEMPLHEDIYHVETWLFSSEAGGFGTFKV